MIRPYLLLTCLALASCSSTQSLVQMSTDTIQITAKGHGECTLDKARDVAVRRIAVETIRRGYEGYVILNSATRSDHREQEFTARMYHKGSAAGAINARSSLGPDWEKTVANFNDESCRL